MKDIIMSELRQLEEEGQLGVEFVQVKRGDRICTPYRCKTGQADDQ